MSKITLAVLTGMLRGYRRLISPFLGSACRFHPSCSQYAIDALTTHGVGRGSWLAVKRVGRCHPWHEGGFDPVPSPKSDSLHHG
jgi:putative membrane protein insertion efficiency factor